MAVYCGAALESGCRARFASPGEDPASSSHSVPSPCQENATEFPTTVAVSASDSVLVVGDLTLDEDSHEVRRAGEEIHLTATEFELLRYLMRNPRRVLSKAQILDRVWNYDFGGQANVVELYISYLRKKIDAGRDPMIHTMRGAGYVLKPAV